jgi:phosphoglycerate kinase
MRNLLKIVDALFIGGGMTFTFLKSQGIPIGGSLCEDEELKTAAELLKAYPNKIHLPVDILIADTFSNDARTRSVLVKEGVPPSWLGMDIGHRTIEEWSTSLKKAATIFWNGPLGVFEMPLFAIGTQAIAQTLASAKAKTIVGGGDSVAAIHQMGLEDRFAHLSTGGGASLELLEFGHLPGIDALSDSP